MRIPLFAITLLAGIALVVVGGLNLDFEREVIYCVTTPCPPAEEVPLWPKVTLAAGIALMAFSAYLVYRLR